MGSGDFPVIYDSSVFVTHWWKQAGVKRLINLLLFFFCFSRSFFFFPLNKKKKIEVERKPFNFVFEIIKKRTLELMLEQWEEYVRLGSSGCFYTTRPPPSFFSFPFLFFLFEGTNTLVLSLPFGL